MIKLSAGVYKAKMHELRPYTEFLVPGTETRLWVKQKEGDLLSICPKDRQQPVRAYDLQVYGEIEVLVFLEAWEEKLEDLYAKVSTPAAHQ